MSKDKELEFKSQALDAIFRDFFVSPVYLDKCWDYSLYIIYTIFNYINKTSWLSFMVAPCINNIKHFIVQLVYTKFRGLSPRANYTDRAAAAGRRS